MIFTLAVQKVELVNQDGWWTQHGNAVILAFAAITAAFVAAYVAIWSHRQQLAHDRNLRDREDVRNTIDASVVSANEGRNIVDLFLASVQTIEEKRDEDTKVSSEFIRTAKQERHEAVSKIQGMRAAQVRLEMRLGEKHAIPTTHWATLLAYNELTMKALDGIVSRRDKAVQDGDDAREKAAIQEFKKFQVACRHWLQQQ